MQRSQSEMTSEQPSSVGDDVFSPRVPDENLFSPRKPTGKQSAKQQLIRDPIVSQEPKIIQPTSNVESNENNPNSTNMQLVEVEEEEFKQHDAISQHNSIDELRDSKEMRSPNFVDNLSELSITQDVIQYLNEQGPNIRSGENEVNLLSDIKPSILIVDDEAMNREVLNAMLVELGYTNNDQAFSGNGALQQIYERFELVRVGQARMYQVILLDYSMPDLDGPQVAQRIRQFYYDNPLLTEDQVPYICCCTAYREANFKKKAMQAGMDKFLTKPIEM